MKIATLLAALWLIWAAGIFAFFVLPMPGPDLCWHLLWGAGGWELARRSIVARLPMLARLF